MLKTYSFVLRTLIQKNGVQINRLQEGRKLHNKKLNRQILHAIGLCPVGLISVFKVRVVRWSRYVARMKVMRSAYKGLGVMPL